MDYNNRTYVTLLTSDAQALGLSESNRRSLDGTITITEYEQEEVIPQEVLNVVINTMTHQQALNLVSGEEWTQSIIDGI